ncbi:putative NTPase NACHT family protein [Halomicronema hongdechloris C2206]|uniref:NTPase NACHT family protein n=1 Tax=Halomicronema hongdechloris C2206 TaxID=1641165 RepID=A0A1Z3HJC0_9CYAN|nr:NACHT domain-containing protein [Halomicronema hongdechloris]ASC70383.1 putative NTPase NACHT family protein [Halomicronema hongdechloris C2206]
MPQDLKSIIQRVVGTSLTPEQQQQLVEAIQSGQATLVTGDRALAMGGNADNAVLITGDHNIIGDGNIIFEGADAEIIRQYLRPPPAPIDSIIEQVRSRASEKGLRNFGKIQLLNRRQVDVDQLYVDVYVLEVQDYRANIPELLKGQNVRKQFDRLGLAKRGERLQGLQIAESEEYPRLMVLGKPGSGKSTFLRHLAVGCAKGDFLENYIPYLLELRDVDEAEFSLFRHIHEEFELAEEEQTKQLLRQGKVMVLLDGLDEVSSVLQPKVQDELRRFAKQYDKNRFVLTCRTQTTKYIPEQFIPIEVADFKPEQVESFALNWFTAIVETPEEGEALKEHFMEKLGEHPQTAELAVTPVLLSLTCWIFEDSQCLPEKRSDLYREGLDLLLGQWDDRRGINRETKSEIYRQLTLEERKQLLSYLAVRKFEQTENFVLFDKAEACSYIAEHLQISTEESGAVLESISEQHGILVEQAHEIWSFSHLTFQEYLVSRPFYTSNNWKDLARQLYKEHWKEVFLLVIDNTQDLDALFRTTKHEIDLYLEDEKFQCFLSWVSRKANTFKYSYQPSSLRALALILAFDDSDSFTELPYALGIHLNFDHLPGENPEEDELLICEFAVDRNLKTALSPQLRFAVPIVLEQIIPNELSYLSKSKEIGDEIQKLIDALPDWWLKTRLWGPCEAEKMNVWWQKHGEEWIISLRNLMVKYRDFGYDWGFSDAEKEKLIEYYNANYILVECLHSGDHSNTHLIQEIEDGLILPLNT